MKRPTGACAQGRHDICPGGGFDHGERQRIYCPCNCHDESDQSAIDLIQRAWKFTCLGPHDEDERRTLQADCLAFLSRHVQPIDGGSDG